MGLGGLNQDRKLEEIVELRYTGGVGRHGQTSPLSIRKVAVIVLEVRR